MATKVLKKNSFSLVFSRISRSSSRSRGRAQEIEGNQGMHGDITITIGRQCRARKASPIDFYSRGGFCVFSVIRI